MRRAITMSTIFALAIAFSPAGAPPALAGAKASPPQSSAYGKSLSEWMQLDIAWILGGGPDHVGNVQFLPLPAGDCDGAFTYAAPGVCTGHLDISLAPGSPFVVSVIGWFGERYSAETGYPDDPPLPAWIFTDNPRDPTVKVYIDGKPVMDSTLASVSQFYYGPVPLDITYAEPSPYGSIGVIFSQGIGFVHPPLSVGTHTIALESELLIPPDGAFLNLDVYPDGVGIRYINTWTVTVAPKH